MVYPQHLELNLAESKCGIVFVVESREVCRSWGLLTPTRPPSTLRLSKTLEGPLSPGPDCLAIHTSSKPKPTQGTSSRNSVGWSNCSRREGWSGARMIGKVPVAYEDPLLVEKADTGKSSFLSYWTTGLRRWHMVKNLPANAGDTRDTGSIPGSGRSPGGGNGSPFQYSCLENSMDRGTWWAMVHQVAKSHWATNTPHTYFLSYPFPLWFITGYGI